MAFLTIYVDENFSGAGFDIAKDVPDLKEFNDGLFWNWKDETSSIRIRSGTWTFYEHVNYDGARMTLGPGEYPNMHPFPVKDNQLSSIKLISE